MFTYIGALIIDFGEVAAKLNGSKTEENDQTKDSNTQDTMNELVQLHTDILE